MRGTKTIALKKVDSILEELVGMQERIIQRAYEIFLGRNGGAGSQMDDWLAAENDIAWRPAVELREDGNQFIVEAATAGVDAQDLDVRITPEDLLIEAEVAHNHKGGKGVVHLCEFKRGKLYRQVHFPKRINPDGVKAEYTNGMLRLTIPIEEAKTAKTVKIEAA